MTKPLYNHEENGKEIPSVKPVPPAQKRSIRDIPLSTRKNSDSQNASNGKRHRGEGATKVRSEERDSIYHQVDIKRDVEPVADLTEEEMRLEVPLEHASKVEHIDVTIHDQPKKIRKIHTQKTEKAVRKRMHDMKPMPENHTFDSFPTNKKHRSSRHTGVYIFILLVLVAAFALWSTVFATATVIVTAPPQSVNLEPTTLPIPVAYEAFTKNSEKTVSINNLAMVSVERKATGNVIIYNNYSTEPYELIATTRFQTANGSVYHLLSDVKVPGKKGNTPGSIEAKVEAAKPGSEYNARGGLDLKLPGLIAGTQKYVNIYAKTASNFTGGETGTAPNTSSQEVKNAAEAVKNEAQEVALKEFGLANPDKFILPDSIKTTYTLGTIKANGTKTDIQVRTTFKAIGLSKTDLKDGLNQIFAEKKMVLLEEDDLRASISINQTSDAALLNGTFSVSVRGDIKTGYSFTPETLKSVILGKSAEVANSAIIASMPQSSVEISIKPFWKHTLPKNAGKLNLIIQ